ncbi:MAG: NAD+ synthase [Pseudomonadota bacterium]
MKLAIAQINLTVGDLKANAAKIQAAAGEAKAAGASLLLTPEMSICGYAPEDLVLREDFCAACEAEVNELAAAAEGITLIVGFPHRVDKDCYNAAAVLQGGKIAAIYHKQKLPNDSVFDEMRTFRAGKEACVFDCGGVRFGLAICGDIWEQGPAEHAAAAGARVLLVPNASPFHVNKRAERRHVVRQRVDATNIPLVYCNLLGGQDELLFDGASFVMDAEGRLTHQFPAWEEGVFYVELEGNAVVPGMLTAEPALEADIYQALVTGVRDYTDKNDFPSVVLGLSGGIDSALTLAIAVDALGAKRVHAVMMPSEFTASISLEDALEMAEILGVKYSEIAIKPVYDVFIDQLADEFDQLPFDTAEENIQARIRGTLLMALSNKFGHLVLTTGNKSEMAVGYATLYGDMAGGFAVLKDVPKTLVYRLANYRNGISRAIPQRIIERPPSAELRPNQTDQDSLPPYEILDAIIEDYVERDLSVAEILAKGFDPATVKRIIRLINRAEYKRRQSAPGIRITPRAFGKDRRYPITCRYRPEENIQETAK